MLRHVCSSPKCVFTWHRSSLFCLLSLVSVLYLHCLWF
nr:MAG TPA: hypothetical protein [Caudoviricetes sp.]DAU06781.1 MAG TPA: hypothetical protein [Caudoviricetes sp.]